MVFGNSSSQHIHTHLSTTLNDVAKTHTNTVDKFSDRHRTLTVLIGAIVKFYEQILSTNSLTPVHFALPLTIQN